MNEARYKSAGAHHPDIGFVITGGEDGGFLSTTEISRDGITFEYYTPLPIGLYGHCMVALDNDDGEFFIGGGYSSGVSNKAFIHKGNQWVEVQQMPTARGCKKSNLEVQGEINWMLCIADLMCGPVRASPGGRVEKIVAAGGVPYLDKVEVYDIATNTWEEGE